MANRFLVDQLRNVAALRAAAALGKMLAGQLPVGRQTI
jgi:hypothetical protein